MTEHVTFDDQADHQVDVADTLDDDASVPRGPRWKRVLKRIAITVGVLILLLIVGGFSLFEWGGMSGSVDPTMAPRFAAMVAAGQAQPITARFVIPIPGCTCHSHDPVQTALHRTYRMSECSRCHDGSEQAMESQQQ